MNLLIKSVNIISMTTKIIIPNQDVLIKDGIIQTISSSIDNDGYQLINGKNQYLIPGMHDMHFHHSDIKEAKFDFYKLVANGITTIRNMWGTEETLQLRDTVEKEGWISPRIWTTGPIIDGSPPVWPESTVITTIEEAHQIAIDHKKAGYDYLKVYNNISKDLYQTLLETAKEIGINVVGHLPVAVDNDFAMDMGQYSFEHGKSIKTKAIKRAAQEGFYYTPTLVTDVACNIIQSDNFSDDVLDSDVYQYVSKKEKKAWKESIGFFKDYDFKKTRTYDELMKDIVDFVRYGGLLLAGTDSPMPLCPYGDSLHQELLLMHQGGLTNFEALQSATINAAKSLGTLESDGTIEEGKQANLVLLSANPLKDISNTTKIEGVCLRGRWIGKREIASLWNQIKLHNEEEEDIG